MGVLKLPVVATVFITAAILGDFVNFWIGSKVGTAGKRRDAGVAGDVLGGREGGGEGGLPYAEESGRRQRGVA